MEETVTDNVPYSRESFDNIYLDLSKESGKCRFAETGFGWKPSGGGDTFTLDHSNIGGAQWSRAAKGYEVKILQRNSGIVQLDGFAQEVTPSSILLERNLMVIGLRPPKQGLQELVQYESRTQGACTSWMELGQRRVWKGGAGI
jgi:POB3-like N-terminal PH domain